MLPARRGIWSSRHLLTENSWSVTSNILKCSDTKLKLKKILRAHFRVSTNQIRIFVLKASSVCPCGLSILDFHHSVFLSLIIFHTDEVLLVEKIVSAFLLLFIPVWSQLERIHSLTSDYPETFGVHFLCSRIRSILTRSTYVLRCTWIGKMDHQTTKYTKKCNIHTYIYCVSCDISVFVITIKRISEKTLRLLVEVENESRYSHVRYLSEMLL